MVYYCKGVARSSLNPFNIKYDKKNKWIGQIGQFKGFVQFSSQGYGIRAGIKLLYRYVFDFGLTNIDDIVSRFCPRSVDGNSKTFDDYVKFVTSRQGLNPVNTDYGFLSLCKSIALYESSCPLQDVTVYFLFSILHLSFTNKNY